MEEIKLGSKVRDSINGFQGVVIERHISIGGFDQCLIKPEKLKEDGGVITSQWVNTDCLLPLQ